MTSCEIRLFCRVNVLIKDFVLFPHCSESAECTSVAFCSYLDCSYDTSVAVRGLGRKKCALVALAKQITGLKLVQNLIPALFEFLGN